MVTIMDSNKPIDENSMVRANGRFSSVYKRWEKVIDHLMTQDWNGTDAYLEAYPKVSRRSASVGFVRLMDEERFRKYFRYLQETKYGVSEESIVAFWQSKMHGAHKEDNALRASENMAKYRQMPGFSKDEDMAPQIKVFIAVKNG